MRDRSVCTTDALDGRRAMQAQRCTLLGSVERVADEIVAHALPGALAGDPAALLHQRQFIEPERQLGERLLRVGAQAEASVDPGAGECTFLGVERQCRHALRQHYRRHGQGPHQRDARGQLLPRRMHVDPRQSHFGQVSRRPSAGADKVNKRLTSRPFRCRRTSRNRDLPNSRPARRQTWRSCRPVPRCGRTWPACSPERVRSARGSAHHC